MPSICLQYGLGVALGGFARPPTPISAFYFLLSAFARMWLWVALTANSGLSPNDTQRAWPKRFTTWQVCPEAGDAHRGHARPSSPPRRTTPLRDSSLPIVPQCSSSAAHAQSD